MFRFGAKDVKGSVSFIVLEVLGVVITIITKTIKEYLFIIS